MFSLLKPLSTSVIESSPTGNPQFHVSYFQRIVSSLLLCPSSKRKISKNEGLHVNLDVLDSFQETWFSVYDDIRWFFLREST